MKRTVLLLLSIAMIALPLAAEVDLGLWAVQTSFEGENTLDDIGEVVVNFDENVGYGLTADIYWTPRISTEIGVYGIDADASLVLGGIIDEIVDLGSLDVMPITLTLRAHFGGDRFDGYIGAGAVYAMIDDLESADLRLGGTEFIEIDDEFTWLANAGFSIRIAGGFRLGVDAKWIPLEVDTIDDQGFDEIPFELDPLMISAGLILRF